MLRELKAPRSIFLRSGRAPVIVPTTIISPPSRKTDRASRNTKNRHGKDKKRKQTASVHGASDQIHVVFEDARLVVAKIELSVEAGDDLAEDYTGLALIVRDVACVLDELRYVDVPSVEGLDLGEELLDGQQS